MHIHSNTFKASTHALTRKLWQHRRQRPAIRPHACRQLTRRPLLCGLVPARHKRPPTRLHEMPPWQTQCVHGCRPHLQHTACKEPTSQQCHNHAPHRAQQANACVQTGLAHTFHCHRLLAISARTCTNTSASLGGWRYSQCTQSCGCKSSSTCPCSPLQQL